MGMFRTYWPSKETGWRRDTKIPGSEPRRSLVPSSKYTVDLDGGMPGVLRFGKRENGVEKKEVPGVLRFGKRTNKKSMPGVLRFGKRNVPGVLRFGKREMPGVLR
ncbi:hypothetical protein TELCIR_06210 [Teladorsagia circumcincta]|uniref:Uncharacterized protein n=1 Tax=Teladorsagia circumcincta TaxID=45464 RepID=A0A2G9UNM1_TELCI|nr:hypothetical protein TELCIR_06210 [Teladorsagia circumcincta]